MLRKVALVAISIAALGVGWVYAQQARSAPTLTTQDYIDIQQLYANYAHALDKGEGARFAATFVTDGEFTGGRPAGQANAVRTPLKGTEALTKMGSGGGSRHLFRMVATPGECAGWWLALARLPRQGMADCNTDRASQDRRISVAPAPGR